MDGKCLGKIEQVRFGFGGYQDSQFGLSVTLGDGSWCVGSFRGDWGIEVKVTKDTKWTDAERDRAFSDLIKYVNQLLIDAKVKSVEQLEGIPVEVEFDNRVLKSWRVLKEVL